MRLSLLTSCWTRTMSIRFWAPGDRLVPISSTRLCTCCMSIVGLCTWLDGICHSPATIRLTRTLWRPASDSSWDRDRRVNENSEWKRKNKYTKEWRAGWSPWLHRLRMDAWGSAVSCRTPLCLDCGQSRNTTTPQSSDITGNLKTRCLCVCSPVCQDAVVPLPPCCPTVISLLAIHLHGSSLADDQQVPDGSERGGAAAERQDTWRAFLRLL